MRAVLSDFPSASGVLRPWLLLRRRGDASPSAHGRVRLSRFTSYTLVSFEIFTKMHATNEKDTRKEDMPEVLWVAMGSMKLSGQGVMRCLQKTIGPH